MVGAQVAGKEKTLEINEARIKKSGIDIGVIDEDDLLDDPADIIGTYCKTVGLGGHESMLQSNNDKDHEQAKNVSEKWKGFHEDVLESAELKPRRDVSIDPGMFCWDSEA